MIWWEMRLSHSPLHGMFFLIVAVMTTTKRHGLPSSTRLTGVSFYIAGASTSIDAVYSKNALIQAVKNWTGRIAAGIRRPWWVSQLVTNWMDYQFFVEITVNFSRSERRRPNCNCAYKARRTGCSTKSKTSFLWLLSFCRISFHMLSFFSGTICVASNCKRKMEKTVTNFSDFC